MLNINKALFFITFILFLPTKTYANQDYYEEINIDNFKEVINKGKGGVYKNPLENDRLFILSFNSTSDRYLDSLPDKYNYLLPYAYFYTTVSGIFVAHIHDELSNLRFNVFNFIENSDAGIFTFNVFKGTNLEDCFHEAVFLHEIFHLHHNTINNYKFEEIKADLFSVIALARILNQSKQQMIDSFNSFSYLRFNFLNKDFKNNKELIDFNNSLLEKINDDYNYIESLENFHDIASYVIKL